MDKNIICPACGHQFKLPYDQLSDLRGIEFHETVREQVETEKNKIVEEVRRTALAEAELEYQKKISDLNAQISKLEKENKDIISYASRETRKKEAEIAELQAQKSAMEEQLRLVDERVKLAVTNAIMDEKEKAKDKDMEIARLRENLVTKDNETKLLILNSKMETEKQIAEKQAELDKMKAMQETKEKELEAKYLELLKEKEDKIAQIKDFRAKLSVKMVGESLELYVKQLFDAILPFLPEATFEKDNQLDENNEKGDFIFREDYRKVELLSVMFECKNQDENSVHKHKNADFLAKLDRNRKAKKCRYAVLVSTLEPDNDFFNQGIVCVNEYPDMYIVRPDQAVTLVKILRAEALKNAEYRTEIDRLKAESIDVSNFEENLGDFKAQITKTLNFANKKKEDAIAKIDRAITILQQIKADIEAFDSHMAAANKKAEKMTIRRLTSNVPSIAAAIKESREETKEIEVLPELEFPEIEPE